MEDWQDLKFVHRIDVRNCLPDFGHYMFSMTSYPTLPPNSSVGAAVTQDLRLTNMSDLVDPRVGSSSHLPNLKVGLIPDSSSPSYMVLGKLAEEQLRDLERSRARIGRFCNAHEFILKAMQEFDRNLDTIQISKFIANQDVEGRFINRLPRTGLEDIRSVCRVKTLDLVNLAKK